MNETKDYIALKIAVKEAIRKGRRYYSHNVSQNDKAHYNAVLDDFHKAQEAVREIDQRVYRFIENCTALYLYNRLNDTDETPMLSYQQCYALIRVATFIDLSMVEEG